MQDLVTRRQQILPGLNTIAALAASPNGQFLACSGDGWDAFGRSPVSLWRLCDDGDDDAADAGAFADEAGSPSGVGSGGSGWRLLGNLHFHDTVITTLHFSADNRYLVSVGSPTEPEDDEGEASTPAPRVVHVCVWDVASGSVAADGVAQLPPGADDGTTFTARWCPWSVAVDATPPALARQSSVDSAVPNSGGPPLEFVVVSDSAVTHWWFSPGSSSLKYQRLTIRSDVRRAVCVYVCVCVWLWLWLWLWVCVCVLPTMLGVVSHVAALCLRRTR